MAFCLPGSAVGNAEVTACHQELSTKVISGALDTAQCQYDRGEDIYPEVNGKSGP